MAGNMDRQWRGKQCRGKSNRQLSNYASSRCCPPPRHLRVYPTYSISSTMLFRPSAPSDFEDPRQFGNPPVPSQPPTTHAIRPSIHSPFSVFFSFGCLYTKCAHAFRSLVVLFAVCPFAREQPSRRATGRNRKRRTPKTKLGAPPKESSFNQLKQGEV